jgi:hypothetical protein
MRASWCFIGVAWIFFSILVSKAGLVFIALYRIKFAIRSCQETPWWLFLLATTSNPYNIFFSFMMKTLKYITCKLHIRGDKAQEFKI